MRSLRHRRGLHHRFSSDLTSARQRARRSAYCHLMELEPRVLMAGTPTQLLFVTPPSQAAAGSIMYPAITVKIADASGLQTSDTSAVTLRISQGPTGATINNATTVTLNAVSGLATFSNLVFSKPGTYTVSVSDGSLQAATSSTFSITPAAAQLNFQHPIGGQTAGVPFTASIEVDDASGLGHPVTTDRSTVTLSIAAGPDGGTIIGNTTATAINGVITFSGLELDTAGTYRFTVADGALTGATSNAFIVSPAAASGLAFAPEPGSANVNATIPTTSVDVVDSFGNVVTSSSATITIGIFSGTPTAGTLSGTTSVAAINGSASFTDLSINAAGTYALGAAAGSLTMVSTGFNITGPADHVAFLTQPTTTTANVIIAPAVQVAVEDALGHVIVNDTSSVTIAVFSGAGTLSGTTTVQAVNGVATFSDLTLNVAGTAQFVATDSVLTSATSNVFTMLPAPAAITFTQNPGNVALNSPMFPAIVVTVLDNTGTPVLTDTSAVTLAIVNGPAGGSMNGTTTVNAVAGQATFDDLTFTKQGTYTLLAYDGNLVTETSIDFVVTPAAAKLGFVTQPITTSMAGVTLSAFTVRVTDASGKLVSTDHSNVTLSINGPTGATIGGTTTVTAINGIATFSDIYLTKAGKYTFTAADSSLTPAASSALTITPLLTPIPDPNISNLLDNPMLGFSNFTASTLVGKVLPTVTVTDQDKYGNVITTVNGGTVSIYILNGPQMTLNGTLTARFVKGIATFKNLTISTAGTYTLQVFGRSTIPAATPYPVHGTANSTIVITPIVNSLRAPAHASGYASGATINLTASVGSLVSSSSILYTNGTVGESVRLVTVGGTTLETGTIATNGAVSFHFNDLAPGTYDVRVIYDGDTNHTGARSPVFEFAVGPTSTALTALPATVNSGSLLTLTATVTDVLAHRLVTSGSVEFFQDGSLTPVTTVSISTTSAHTAVYSFATSATGTHTYTAVFVANSSLNASTSVTKLVSVV